jgi:hypothetical protein
MNVQGREKLIISLYEKVKNSAGDVSFNLYFIKLFFCVRGIIRGRKEISVHEKRMWKFYWLMEF